MIKTPIHDFLVNYSREKQIRCHTPGHKGSNLHDITEIDGADSLYEANGIIKASEDIAAGLFGTAGTFYSCSGSTLAIQAMLKLIRHKGRRIAAFRYAHRSFVSAAALFDFEIDWIYPDEFLCAKINAETVKKAIKPDTAAVFVNSLDYYGGMCDIKAIAEVCKKASIPLLVDNAYGAYLIFTDDHPIKLGATMTSDSAHKTLPVLTGGAYLHVNDINFAKNTKAAMALFGTTSPSYLILESLDLCNRHIANRNTEAFESIEDLKNIELPLRKSDKLRITIKAREYGYTGFEFAEVLKEKRVVCEYADENYTVLLFSTITARADTAAVRHALESVKKKKPLSFITYPVIKPKKIMNVREALFAPDSECEIVAAKNAAGRICAGIYAPCPPGIPLIMPGERIEQCELSDTRMIRVI
jgi:arginine/lysine/ornithine decarboxylase